MRIGFRQHNPTNLVALGQAETWTIFPFEFRKRKMSVLGERLKEARVKSGLSQEQLGLQAGLEVESASARMNRYERGTRVPGVELMERIGNVLDMPLTFFYAPDREEAQLVVLFHRMQQDDKEKLLTFAEKLANP
jgi:transcriptional regulator with XRE-family HTH domain